VPGYLEGRGRTVERGTVIEKRLQVGDWQTAPSRPCSGTQPPPPPAQLEALDRIGGHYV